MFREPHVYLSQGGLMLKYVAKSFAPKKTTFTNSEKIFREVSCSNPGSLCNGQSRHGPLDRQSYTATAKKIKQMQHRLNLPLF